MKLMQKAFFPILLTVISSGFLFAFTKPENGATTVLKTTPKLSNRDTAVRQNEFVALYDSLDLKSKGLSKEAFDFAVEGYQKLLSENRIANPEYLTIIDFSQSSRKKRFYLINVDNKKLVENTFVAHGKNSGIDEAKSFSNIPESNQSSLGFYLTKATYTGKHGLSLRLSGLEKGINDNAEARAIVVHGAEYVSAARVSSSFMGRSLGCPALPQEVSSEVISKIKGGSLLFIYYPQTEYATGSELIQGIDRRNS